MKKQESNWWKAIYCVFIFLYAGFLFFTYLQTDALVPDEEWFWGLAANEIQWESIEDVIFTPNYLGYGSIYWIILKVLRSFTLVRLFNACMMVSAACLVLYTVKYFHGASDRQIFFSAVIYFSCPLVWFTGKIIGPEIIGYTLGVAGCSAGLLGYQKKKWGIYTFSIFLLGISAGIKLNDIVFSFFLMFYVFLDRIGHVQHWKQLVSKSNVFLFLASALGSCGGVVISNPIILKDWALFQSGFAIDGYSLQNLRYVLTGTSITWDLVNAGGMNKTMISLTALFLIFLLGFLCLKDRKLMAAGFFSILLLIALCCKGRFLGWYLLPMIYIVCICIPDTTVMAAAALINFCVMYPGVRYQIVSKISQIQNIKNTQTIQSQMLAWEDGETYQEYEKYCFIETCVKEYPMFAVYVYANEISDKRIIFISPRAQANEQIHQIYQKAFDHLDGYRLVDETELLAFIVYEQTQGQSIE